MTTLKGPVELEHYKMFIISFSNNREDKLVITTVGKNKYPTLGIQEKDSNEIHKIGTVTDPAALIKWLNNNQQGSL